MNLGESVQTSQSTGGYLSRRGCKHIGFVLCNKLGLFPLCIGQVDSEDELFGAATAEHADQRGALSKRRAPVEVHFPVVEAVHDHLAVGRIHSLLVLGAAWLCR